MVHLGRPAIDVADVRAAHSGAHRHRRGRGACVRRAVRHRRHPVGSSGNLTCFSFYANKNLSTGEGGAIALFDRDDGGAAPIAAAARAAAGRLEALRGSATPGSAPAVTELGYKMNYTDLQAAIGRVQLRRQAEHQAHRAAIARIYADALAELPWPVPLQAGVTGAAHARHLFLIQLPVERIGCPRNDVLAALRERNIGASIHYQPVHTMPPFASPRTGALPVTERVAARILTLPISASMSLDDARLVAAALSEVLAAGAAHPIAAAGRS